MSKLELNVNEMFALTAEARKSDDYSDNVFIKLTRNYKNGTVMPCGDMFLTPTQLELLGKYFIRQADEVRLANNAK